ncbi:Ndufc2p [Halocaridina rubra]|uniref:Ndufc2p n=1 Tax=Halocaridina rubra TaxID=373956 RepID=A0AAN8X229_HALRR
MEVDERTEIDPAEYFNPERSIPYEGVIKRYWYPVVMGLAGASFGCGFNFIKRRPVFSGLQIHVLGGAIGMLLGITVDNYATRKMAHRDLMLYEYIRSHPDDFPPIERKKYAQVLEPWVPIR